MRLPILATCLLLSTAFIATGELPASLESVLPGSSLPETRGVGAALSFDDLARDYAARLEKAARDASGEPIVLFETLLGSIAFFAEDVTVTWVDMTDPVPAFVRIGKRQSMENRELIFAWLTEAAAMKRQQGYEETAQEEFPTTYGRATFTLLRKDDQYFTTYVQYDRTRNAEGEMYLTHTYHVEFGCWSRAGIFRQEQAALKLGN